MRALPGPSFRVDSAGVEGEQDLINAAAVETIRGRGEVYILDPKKLAQDRPSPIAAVLRYSKGDSGSPDRARTSQPGTNKGVL